MITNDHMQQYHGEGYLLLKDVVPPVRLPEVRESYDRTVHEALWLDLADKNPETGGIKKHRAQNPHHPALVQGPLMEVLCAPALVDFYRRRGGSVFAFYSAVLFVMREDYDHPGAWHWDSYGLWGKDSAKEKATRTLPVCPSTQILVVFEDDDCFWFVPGSHNRANTPDEEARFEQNLIAATEIFPGAVPFDFRGIHRGLKPLGRTRRALFMVYGVPEEMPYSKYTEWSADPAFADPSYLASLPDPLRQSIEQTIKACKNA